MAMENELDLTFADENFQLTFFVTNARKKFAVRWSEQRNYAELTAKKIWQSRRLYFYFASSAKLGER